MLNPLTLHTDTLMMYCPSTTLVLVNGYLPCNYLSKRGVNVTYLRLFNRRNDYSIMSAKLNVALDSESVVEAENFWPNGVLQKMNK